MSRPNWPNKRIEQDGIRWVPQAEALHEIISLRARLHKVSGWRESDWPEWFDRRTANALADWAAQE